MQDTSAVGIFSCHQRGIDELSTYPQPLLLMLFFYIMKE